jgi:hypothetical protein
MNTADLKVGSVIRHLKTGDLYSIMKFALDKSSCGVADFNSLEEKNIKGLASIELGYTFELFFEVVPPEEVNRMKSEKI